MAMETPTGDPHQGSVSAEDLRCEYLRDPLGLGVRRPRLSWLVHSGQAGQRQTAYHILASSARELPSGPADLWDSGRIPSAASSHVPYGGPPLGSAERVYWRVQLWDSDDRAGPVSGPGSWEMGLLDPADWEADWIAGPDPAPLFRRAFDVLLQVASARLYVCGQGVYEARINGRPVSDEVLGPQLSVFPERMLYDTFDVSALLHAGHNALAIRLVPGWFGSDRANTEVIARPAGARHALIAQLAVRCADGSAHTIATNASWRTAASHFEPVRSHWYHCYQGSGERLDAEKEPQGWDAADFDDTTWAAARKIEAPTKRLCPRMIEPNRIVESLPPVAVSRLREPVDHDGFVAMVEAAGARNWSLETMTNPVFAEHWRREFARSYDGHGNQPLAGFEADFGKHVSGWVTMDVTGDPGGTVTVFGLDQHRLRGLPDEPVGQRFMHRAFRYVPIHVSGKAKRPLITNIRAHALQNDVRRTGRFECSDPVLNRIHDVAARTWAAHLLSGMPMDSWRERFGTALIENCESSMYWCDVGAFHTKWMTDHRDSQRPDGYLPMSGGPIAYDYWAPNWGKNGIVLVPWLMYLFYADRQAVEANYTAMRRWLRLCAPKSDAGRTWQPPADHGESEAGYGDHARPSSRWYDPQTGDLFKTLHTIHCFRMAEQMAGLLDQAEDVRWFAQVRARLTAKVNRSEFLDRTHGLYGDGDQGCHALALHERVAPLEVREQVARHLLTDIMETRGGHLHTGFLGTWYLLKALIAMDQPDVAVTVLANQTPPSFASLLRHVDSPEELTFLPEFFGQGMIPHPGWCSVGFWFYQALAGIMPDWEHPGFAGLTVKAQLPARLDWVRAELDSMVGTVGVSWTRQGPLVELVVRIPANSNAQVHVPALRRASVEAAPGARFAGSAEGSLLFAVDSGTHVFRFEPRAESDWRAARVSGPEP